MYPSRIFRNQYGQGLAATANVPAGQAVAQFDGPIVGFGELPGEEVRYALWIEEGDRWLIPRTSARYLNHSCQPNCQVDENLEVVTLRAVSAGEELTISYNTVDPAACAGNPGEYFWDDRWTFHCRCGAATCQGLIDRYVFSERP